MLNIRSLNVLPINVRSFMAKRALNCKDCKKNLSFRFILLLHTSVIYGCINVNMYGMYIHMYIYMPCWFVSLSWTCTCTLISLAIAIFAVCAKYVCLSLLIGIDLSSSKAFQKINSRMSTWKIRGNLERKAKVEFSTNFFLFISMKFKWQINLN